MRRMTAGKPLIEVPNMKKILAEHKIKRQFWILLSADLGLVLVFYVPSARRRCQYSMAGFCLLLNDLLFNAGLITVAWFDGFVANKCIPYRARSCALQPPTHCEPFNWIVTGYTDGAQDTLITGTQQRVIR